LIEDYGIRVAVAEGCKQEARPAVPPQSGCPEITDVVAESDTHPPHNLLPLANSSHTRDLRTLFVNVL